jgi:23S rRNA (pseudouridine1915-N3)-methyltransferase
MKLILLQTGRTTEKYIVEGVSNYSDRIKKYVSFDILTVPELRNSRNLPLNEKKAKEGEKLSEKINNEDYVLLLDEKGKEYNTIEFAKFLEKSFMLQKKRLLFVIGGPWGFSDDMYKRSDAIISLSKMTFSHQVVRLLFMEQLYRALTVIKGDPYHHA